jgi:hypothetical protein
MNSYQGEFEPAPTSPEDRTDAGIERLLEIQRRIDGLQAVLDTHRTAFGLRSRVEAQIERLKGLQIDAAYDYLPEPPKSFPLPS